MKKLYNTIIIFYITSIILSSLFAINSSSYLNNNNNNNNNNLVFTKMNLSKLEIADKSYDYYYGNSVKYNNGIIVSNQSGFTYFKYDKSKNKYNYKDYKLPNLDSINKSMYLPRVYLDKTTNILYFGIITYLYVQKNSNDLNDFLRYDVDDSSGAPFSSLADTWYDIKKIGDYLFNATREGFWYLDLRTLSKTNTKSNWTGVTFNKNENNQYIIDNAFGRNICLISNKLYTGTYVGSSGLEVATYNKSDNSIGEFMGYSIGPSKVTPEPYSWNDTMDMKLSSNGLLYIANYDYYNSVDNNITLNEDNNLYLNVSKSKNDLVHFNKYNINNIKKIEFDNNNNLYLINDNSLRIAKDINNINNGFYTYSFPKNTGIGDAYIDNDNIFLTCNNGEGGIYLASTSHNENSKKPSNIKDYIIIGGITIAISVLTAISFVIFNVKKRKRK